MRLGTVFIMRFEVRVARLRSLETAKRFSRSGEHVVGTVWGVSGFMGEESRNARRLVGAGNPGVLLRQRGLTKMDFVKTI